MTKNQNILLPCDCVTVFHEVFEYAPTPEVLVGHECSVLDIGANVGAFAILASWWFRPKLITCYEPNPELVPILIHNAQFSQCPVHVSATAVGDQSQGTLFMANGVTRLKGSQVKPKGESYAVNIKVTHPHSLGPADIVKIDCEGAEGFILENILFTPQLLMVEYHSKELMERCTAAMSAKMKLIEHQDNGDFGLLKFIKNNG